MSKFISFLFLVFFSMTGAAQYQFCYGQGSGYNSCYNYYFECKKAHPNDYDSYDGCSETTIPITQTPVQLPQYCYGGEGSTDCYNGYDACKRAHPEDYEGYAGCSEGENI